MTNNTRWLALFGVQLAVLAVGLDITVLSVALPTLAGALHASESDLQWFSSGYTLVLAAAMLPAGLLGDRFGRKRVMLTALALFGVGSAACALAPNAGAFLVARLALGLAGAGVIVMAVTALTVLFSEEERPRAVAIWAAANFLAMPIGPILGGWILTNFWWGWVFLINVPVAAIGLVVGLILVPESRSSNRPGLDPVGVAASSAGLVGVTFGLIEAGQNGWVSVSALLPIAAGLAILAGFFWWEAWLSRRPAGQPLLDLSLFRSPAFLWGVILVTVGTLALIGIIFTLPQYFQGVLGVNAMGSGIRLLPLIAGFVIGLAPADRVARLAGRKITVALGFALLGAGMTLGATTSITTSTGFTVVWMVVSGAGLGLMFATAAAAALSELTAERSGVGSAMMQALKNVGAPFGSAVLGSALLSAYRSQLHLAGLPGPVASAVREGLFTGLAVAARLKSPSLVESIRVAFIHGMDVSLLVSAGIAAAGIVLTLAFLPGAQRSAQRAGVPAKE